MSIINDALKKAEQSLQKNTAPLPAPARSKPYLIYILILVSGLALSQFIFHLLGEKAKPAPAIKIPPVPKPLVAETKTQIQNSETKPITPQVFFAPLLTQQKKAPESFVLNGIFFSGNDSYALINNQIVRVGDAVDNALVKVIASNYVELENAGQTIKLTTNR